MEKKEGEGKNELDILLLGETPTSSSIYNIYVSRIQ